MFAVFLAIAKSRPFLLVPLIRYSPALFAGALALYLSPNKLRLFALELGSVSIAHSATMGLANPELTFDVVSIVAVIFAAIVDWVMPRMNS